jgi:hypothetical protein
MDFAATMRLLLSLSFIFGRIHAGSERLHRVFPAAQVELYDIESNTLGVVKPSSLSIKSFGPPTTDKVVRAAINRFQKTLSQLPDFVEDYEENPEHNQLQDITTVELHVLSPNVELVEGVDESYILSIEEKSSDVMLRAYTVFGIVHGLETLGQLLEFGWMNDNGETVFTVHDLPLSMVRIPRLADRHFQALFATQSHLVKPRCHGHEQVERAALAFDRFAILSVPDREHARTCYKRILSPEYGIYDNGHSDSCRGSVPSWYSRYSRGGLAWP